MFGLPTQLSLKILDRTYQQKIEAIRSSAQHQREIDYFLKNISKVVSVEDLMEDYRLYSFTMKAFDLEEHIPYRAMMKKILESDLEDRSSLANRLVDSRLKSYAKEMGFMYEGSTNLNTISAKWREEMVERYLTVQLETQEGEANPNVEAALYFRRKAPEITNWYQILGDKRLAEVMRKALMLPEQIAAVDVDRQAELFQQRFDIAKFQDPKEVEKLISRYAALADTDPASGFASTASGAGRALSMLTANRSMGLTSQIISIDPVTVQNFGKLIRY